MHRVRVLVDALSFTKHFHGKDVADFEQHVVRHLLLDPVAALDVVRHPLVLAVPIQLVPRVRIRLELRLDDWSAAPTMRCNGPVVEAFNLDFTLDAQFAADEKVNERLSLLLSDQTFIVVEDTLPCLHQQVLQPGLVPLDERRKVFLYQLEALVVHLVELVDVDLDVGAFSQAEHHGRRLARHCHLRSVRRSLVQDRIREALPGEVLVHQDHLLRAVHLVGHGDLSFDEYVKLVSIFVAGFEDCAGWHDDRLELAAKLLHPEVLEVRELRT